MATTAAFCVLAGLGAGPALADLKDLGDGLPDLTSTVDQLTTTVSETTAPLTKTTQDATALLTSPAPAEPSASPDATPPAAESPAPAPPVLLATSLQPATVPVTSSVQQVVSPVLQTAVPAVASVEQTVAEVTTTLEQSAAPLTTTVTETATPLTTTVAETVAPLTTAVVQTAAPVLQAAGETVSAVTTTLEQVAAPVLEAAQQPLAPVVTTTQQALASLVNPLADASLTGAAPRVATPGFAAGRSDGGPTVSPVGTAQAPAEASAPLDLGPQVTSQAPGTRAAARNAPSVRLESVSGPDQAVTRPGFSPLVTDDPAPAAGGPSTSHGANAAGAEGLLPFSPSSPFGFVGSAASSGGGGLFVPLFALGAVMFLLAAQGVGRRLRLAMASPRLPILALSLERPG